jgi:hypothetical protein
MFFGLVKDGKVLPGPVKAKAIVESRKSGTFTTVSLAKEDVRQKYCPQPSKMHLEI